MIATSHREPLCGLIIIEKNSFNYDVFRGLIQVMDSELEWLGYPNEYGSIFEGIYRKADELMNTRFF